MLVFSIFAGLLAGWARKLWFHSEWRLPEFRYAWVVLVFFIPQFLAYYLPATRDNLSTPVAAACLMVSQTGLLFFCIYHWRLRGMPILALGLLLNLLAIGANGGLMPLSTTTAAYLLPEQVLSNLKIGARFGLSKDVLLSPEAIQLPWLADRFLSPAWINYKFVFSLGDVLIALGAFLLLAFPSKSLPFLQER